MPNQPLPNDDPLKGKKSGKWTKWGGAIYGLVKEEIEDIWACQCCGIEQPAELKPFLFELFPGDFIRVCNICMNHINKIRGQDKNPTIIYRRTVQIFRKIT